ncbi:ankyrin repeat domain-containing protein [Stenotrophomonas pigmentata]|uniref:ankyrin repeat domain-containing protein n=1 Tax=Stenotrophomonas pigmentata TaxID=3055080 RepID=UPI0026EF6A36|nr:ankyrin repeat domain-containing protein [Stenotrophomonas sp. 610A2]
MNQGGSHFFLLMTTMQLAGQLRRRKGRVLGALDRQGRSLLHWLILANRLDLAALLVDAGVRLDIQDRRGREPLHYARSQKAVDLLINAGANANARDLAGRTALHMCIRKDRGEIVAALLKRGGDVHMKDASGLNALHHAAQKGQAELVRSLIEEHGVYVDARDKHGRHALYHALSGGHLGSVKALLDGGADLAKIDFKGTPWHQVASMEQIGTIQEYAKSAAQAQKRVGGWTPDPLAMERLHGKLVDQTWSRSSHHQVFAQKL